MMSIHLFAWHEAERPFLAIGMVGSLLALASFFWLPVFWGYSAWDVWLQSAPPSPNATAFWMVTAFGISTCVVLLIGGAALFWPLPRLAAYGYNLALLMGIGVLVFSLWAYFPLLLFSWGGLTMCLGYLCILVGQYAFQVD
jgi:hypothetical protein